jgi:hypothetical protein
MSEDLAKRHGDRIRGESPPLEDAGKPADCDIARLVPIAP